MRRRLIILWTIIAISLAGLALAMTGALTGTASSTTWYQCTNAAGAIESTRGGTVKPVCAHASDPVLTWSVAPSVPPVVTTTTSSATTDTTAATTSPTTLPATTTTVSTVGVWHPSSAHPISWDWIIGADPPSSVNVQMLDWQGDTATAQQVAAYRAKGVRTVCYIDLGTYEPGRTDLNLIPAADIGGNVQGWPGEKWLNIADIPGLTPLINERLGMCAAKGFDAVEVDNVDGYSNTTGFNLTAAEQLAYNRNYAAVAHSLGLSIGLKNDIDQVTALQPYFDWTLNEQCNQYAECGALSAFTANGKAAFNAEYSGGTGFCGADVTGHINGGLFDLALDGTGHTACPGTW